ncbi:MAG: hypothetical protein WAV89_00400 [Ignavibacteriaceae bacterium]
MVYDIERKSELIDWKTIGFMPGNGTTNKFHSYQFQDNDLFAGKYQYRLKQLDNNGQHKYSPAVEVVILPNKFVLYQNYPNPFNPTTTISYDLPVSDFVTLKIYDVLGNQITTLVNKEQPAGYHQINFVEH